MIGLGSRFYFLIHPYNNSIKVHKDFHPSENLKLWVFPQIFLWKIWGSSAAKAAVAYKYVLIQHSLKHWSSMN